MSPTVYFSAGPKGDAVDPIVSILRRVKHAGPVLEEVSLQFKKAFQTPSAPASLDMLCRLTDVPPFSVFSVLPVNGFGDFGVASAAVAFFEAGRTFFGFLLGDLRANQEILP